MKLSKFVKRAKSESYCVVIHADDSGIWLGTRLALYNATELPYMEGKEQLCPVALHIAALRGKLFLCLTVRQTEKRVSGHSVRPPVLCCVLCGRFCVPMSAHPLQGGRACTGGALCVGLAGCVG